MQRTHNAALNLLETVGMAKPAPRVLEMVLENSRTQNEQGRLLFSRDLVENIQWFTRPIVVTDIEDLFEFGVNAIKLYTQLYCTRAWTSDSDYSKIN